MENGKIKVLTSFNSIGITIGRTAFGIPVFNSYATIVYDIPSETIVFLELRNWNQIPEKYPEALEKWNPDKIETAITKRWKNWRPEVNDDIDVLEVILGFKLVPNGLRAAAIHHGKFNKTDPDIYEPQAWIEDLK